MFLVKIQSLFRSTIKPSWIEDLACCGSYRANRNNGRLSVMYICQGEILSSKEQLFLSVLCYQVYKSNSQNCYPDRRKPFFHSVFSSYGNCDQLLPHGYSVLIHHLQICMCNTKSIWSHLHTVRGLSLNYTSKPSVSVEDGWCIWKSWFWMWHKWLPKHMWRPNYVKYVLMIRTYILSMPHFPLTRLSTWGIRILLPVVKL